MAKTKRTPMKFSDVVKVCLTAVKNAAIAVKNWLIPTRIIGIVCLLLTIGLFATMFLPYWTIDETTEMTIFDETWLNYEKPFKNFIKDMKTQLVDANLMTKEAAKELHINDFVYPAVVLSFVSLFAFVCCPFKLGKPLGMAFNLACGGIGIWMCVAHPIYRLGSAWAIILGVSIALVVVTLANIALYLINKFKD